DPDTYLATGRRMVRSSFVLGPKDPEDQARVLFRLIRESRAHFLVRRSGDFDQAPRPEVERGRLAALLERYPGPVPPLFRSRGGGGIVYRTLEPLESHAR